MAYKWRNTSSGGRWFWWRLEASDPSTPTYPPPDFVGEPGQIWSPGDKKKEKKVFQPLLSSRLIDAFDWRRNGPGMLSRDGEIGLELECEGRNLFSSPVRYWAAIPDHSLRPVENHPPVEYVLRDPLSRADVVLALDYLKDRLEQSGSELVFSGRCSVHVHVNCQDLTMQGVAQFLCLYFVFEELLVEFSGPGREGNLFCLRAKDADFQIEVLARAYRTFNFGDVFNQNFRYSSCNATSLGTHGSLEFRSMRGTVDKSLILDWIGLLLHIKDVSLRFRDPSEIVETFTRMGPRAFADMVMTGCPASAPVRNWFLAHKDLHTSLWSGCRTMRDVAYAVDWNNPPLTAGRCVREIDNGEYDDDE